MFFKFSGTYGEVRKAMHKKTGAIRAVKMMLKSQTSEKDRERLFNEVEILKSLVNYLNFSMKFIDYILGSSKHIKNF